MLAKTVHSPSFVAAAVGVQSQLLQTQDRCKDKLPTLHDKYTGQKSSSEHSSDSPLLQTVLAFGEEGVVQALPD